MVIMDMVAMFFRALYITQMEEDLHGGKVNYGYIKELYGIEKRN